MGGRRRPPTWKCVCGETCFAPRRTCQMCGTPRPARRSPKQQLVLDVPYELWVERFGERCNICGRPPGPNRSLDRDHDHTTGEPRGLLCHRCNRGLGYLKTPQLLRAAITYLGRTRTWLS